jgi:hypothetical protein
MKNLPLWQRLIIIVVVACILVFVSLVFFVAIPSFNKVAERHSAIVGTESTLHLTPIRVGV